MSHKSKLDGKATNPSKSLGLKGWYKQNYRQYRILVFLV